MEERIPIKICTGTLCYVMGGSELQLLEDHLPEEIACRVQILGSPCLDSCNNPGAGRAPFVMVGDRLISEASISKVIAAIKELLND